MEKDRKGNAHCHWENGTEEGHAGSIVFVIHHDFGMLNVAEGRGKRSQSQSTKYVRTVGGAGPRSQKNEKTKDKFDPTQQVGFRLTPSER